MRTLFEEICWTISSNRNPKLPIRTDLLKFYNTSVGYFYSNLTTPLYDGENVILKNCEVVWDAFRAIDKERQLAPYALCPNDYDGCPFCNKYKDDGDYNCPYTLKQNKVWLTPTDSLIGFYRLYHGTRYGVREYKKELRSYGINYDNKYYYFKQ